MAAAKRLWELDALRGIAIVMMVVFHFLFDLNFLGIMKINVYEGFLLLFQRATATLFLLVVGATLAFAYHRGKVVFSYYLKRAGQLFAVALLVTLATWIYPHDGFIVFGILHFISLSIVLAYPFLRFRFFNLFASLAVIIVGLFLSSFAVGTNLMLWLGVVPSEFHTLDYFPLFPWFGVVLIGIFLTNYFYIDKKLVLPETRNRLGSALCWLGQRSLAIYLVHQPILISILIIYKYYLS